MTYSQWIPAECRDPWRKIHEGYVLVQNIILPSSVWKLSLKSFFATKTEVLSYEEKNHSCKFYMNGKTTIKFGRGERGFSFLLSYNLHPVNLLFSVGISPNFDKCTKPCKWHHNAGITQSQYLPDVLLSLNSQSLWIPSNPWQPWSVFCPYSCLFCYVT